MSAYIEILGIFENMQFSFSDGISFSMQYSRTGGGSDAIVIPIILTFEYKSITSL